MTAAGLAVGTALVTGATSGIGHATASALVERGYRVLGTTRDPDRVPQTQRIHGVEYLQLDLADEASITACARSAGAVDVLVNNAGESLFGAMEEVPLEALRRHFELNVLGPALLTQLLVPGMRERGHGRVVMVGSMIASFPLAFRSGYTASKAALERFATAARPELVPHGVWLTTVEPGSIATGISARRAKHQADDSPYRDAYDTVLHHLDSHERTGIAPERVAEAIMRAIESPRPRSLYAVGSRAPLVFPLRRLLPRGTVERLVSRAHGLRS